MSEKIRWWVYPHSWREAVQAKGGVLQGAGANGPTDGTNLLDGKRGPVTELPRWFVRNSSPSHGLKTPWPNLHSLSAYCSSFVYLGVDTNPYKRALGCLASSFFFIIIIIVWALIPINGLLGVSTILFFIMVWALIPINGLLGVSTMLFFLYRHFVSVFGCCVFGSWINSNVC